MEFMTVEEIRDERRILERELNAALGNMILNPNIASLHQCLIILQNNCPHKDNIENYSNKCECPYCGKVF